MFVTTNRYLNKMHRLPSRGGLVFVITGQIAVGKTLISRYMSKNGFYYISSDQIAFTILKDNKIINQLFEEILQIKDLSGKKLNIKPVLDYDTLKNWILSLEAKLQKIVLGKVDQIIHPLVQKKQKELIQKITKRGRNIILESPLFFESKNTLKYDLMMMPYVPYNEQIARGIKRKKIQDIKSINREIDKIKVMIDKQIELKNKIQLVDLVILNNNRLATLNIINNINTRNVRISRNSFRYRNYRNRCNG